MQTNFLEEIVAEWYEYQGYIVKRNERVGLRKDKGGYEGELDVVAFNPKKNHIVHVETSTDADSWDNREKRFSKKFATGDKYIKGFFLGDKYIESLFPGLNLPGQIEKKAIFAFGSDKNHKTIGGGEVVLAENFILEILQDLKSKSFASKAVPEKYPILRTLQMITEHREKVIKELEGSKPRSIGSAGIQREAKR